VPRDAENGVGRFRNRSQFVSSDRSGAVGPERVLWGGGKVKKKGLLLNNNGPGDAALGQKLVGRETSGEEKVQSREGPLLFGSVCGSPWFCNGPAGKAFVGKACTKGEGVKGG